MVTYCGDKCADKHWATKHHLECVGVNMSPMESFEFEQLVKDFGQQLSLMYVPKRIDQTEYIFSEKDLLSFLNLDKKNEKQLYNLLFDDARRKFVIENAWHYPLRDLLEHWHELDYFLQWSGVKSNTKLSRVGQIKRFLQLRSQKN